MKQTPNPGLSDSKVGASETARRALWDGLGDIRCLTNFKLIAVEY